ncbi:HoxN/HupN/NixA family nickel/cobalt transporter [Caballeronia sp. LZ008]|uniref:HoxN/HupN/NixA family nickel/cobalt transporter n=1 Tax=unclassified Caballeronia TaxID=2646786 RepID=UPI002027FF30|nr:MULTISPECIES: HoxN/HupN/NixA family nickel/cobalt transporter [unclassified Caballeronia]MDR5797298.1 HoxN/HupN/NixA family nickel/cobalt transporter [Caballeronia sp. LZ008]
MSEPIEPASAPHQAHRNLPRKSARLIGGLIAFNVLAWLWALVAFRHYPLLLGTSLLAYSLGLRHAVDADHIAAIDNVTRKLMHEGKRPHFAGFFFSLGHSTIVIAATALIAATAMAVHGRFAEYREIGGIIGTSVSSLFLFAIAAMNLFVLRGVWRAFRRVRRGETCRDDDIDMLTVGGGPLARIARPLFRLIGKSWHMYPLGFLFGLGFDTATEIGLMGMAAAEAARGMPVWSILVFPMLFTAGMSLIDTADSLLMTGAYGWAFMKPIRKLYYNLTVTLVSVLIAVLIGGIEALGLIADRLRLKGGLWDVAASLSEHFGMLGYGIVALFAACWIVSALIYKWRGYESLDGGVAR